MKHTNTVMQQYCRAVRKKLPLPARQRRQLLAGLQEELAESAPDCATLDALIAQFGTPDETAQELLSSISPEQLQTSTRNNTGGAAFWLRRWPSCSSAAPRWPIARE